MSFQVLFFVTCTPTHKENCKEMSHEGMPCHEALYFYVKL